MFATMYVETKECFRGFVKSIRHERCNGCGLDRYTSERLREAWRRALSPPNTFMCDLVCYSSCRPQEGVAGAGSPRSSGTPEAAAQPNVEASFVQFKVPAQHAAQEGGASDSDAETFRTLADAYRMGPAHGSQITRRKELHSSRTSSIVTSETLNVSVADADVMRRTWSAHNWAESPAQVRVRSAVVRVPCARTPDVTYK